MEKQRRVREEGYEKEKRGGGGKGSGLRWRGENKEQNGRENKERARREKGRGGSRECKKGKKRKRTCPLPPLVPFVLEEKGNGPSSLSLTHLTEGDQNLERFRVLILPEDSGITRKKVQ